jgi:hypothetical protein
MGTACPSASPHPHRRPSGHLPISAPRPRGLITRDSAVQSGRVREHRPLRSGFLGPEHPDMDGWGRKGNTRSTTQLHLALLQLSSTPQPPVDTCPDVKLEEWKSAVIVRSIAEHYRARLSFCWLFLNLWSCSGEAVGRCPCTLVLPTGIMHLCHRSAPVDADARAAGSSLSSSMKAHHWLGIRRWHLTHSSCIIKRKPLLKSQ